MRILAADIGGTNSRFAETTVNSLSDVVLSEPVVIPTWSDSIGSFEQLLNHYAEIRPAGGLPIGEYDALAIGIAGAVSGRRATLPNIPWDIDFTNSMPVKNTYLLNDFIAQAHGFLDPDIFEKLRLVRAGPGSGPGSVAIVGAGTGLGHAALKPVNGERIVIGSEAGHGTFSFHGKDEKKIEASMLNRTGTGWLSGDDVVTGSGIALIHEALTGRALSPAQALQEEAEETPTCAYYARFYARACRDYCLSMYPVESLIISGGIAAKNRHILESDAFTAEFNDGRSYRHLLERIPIYLNEDQQIGLKGAAIHAWLRLNQALTG